MRFSTCFEQLILSALSFNLNGSGVRSWESEVLKVASNGSMFTFYFYPLDPKPFKIK